MESHKISIPKHSGFTLIEIIVSMSIFLLIAGSIAFVSLRSFSSSTDEDEQMFVVSLLQKARSEAMNDICTGDCARGVPHGVHIDANSITIFQGNYFDAHDQSNILFDHIIKAKVSGATDVVFASGSGNASFSPSSATSVVITTNTQSAVIGISPEGMIDWNL